MNNDEDMVLIVTFNCIVCEEENKIVMEQDEDIVVKCKHCGASNMVTLEESEEDSWDV